MSQMYDHQFLVTARSAWASHYIEQMIAADIGVMQGSQPLEDRITFESVLVQPISKKGTERP